MLLRMMASAILALLLLGCGDVHICESFYDDESLEYEVPCNRWNGVYNGRMQVYYPDGKLKAVKYYVNDIEEDSSLLYATNGKTLIEAVPMSGGLRHGLARYYNEQGELQREENFLNGQPSGITRIYYPEGVVAEEYQCIRGIVVGPASYYRRDGTLKRKGNLIRGMETGTWSFYDPTGFKTADITYNNGQRNGAFAIYRDSSLPYLTGFFGSGLVVGELKFYDEEGAIMLVQKYDDLGRTIGEDGFPEELDSLDLPDDLLVVGGEDFDVYFGTDSVWIAQ